MMAKFIVEQISDAPTFAVYDKEVGKSGGKYLQYSNKEEATAACSELNARAKAKVEAEKKEKADSELLAKAEEAKQKVLDSANKKEKKGDA